MSANEICECRDNLPSGFALSFTRPTKLLSDGDIHVPKIVLAELIQDAHSEKDLEVIRAFVEAFTIIGESANTWLEAGRLSFALKKKGKTINLAHCFIAILAKEHKCSVLTLDKHRNDIQKETG